MTPASRKKIISNDRARAGSAGAGNGTSTGGRDERIIALLNELGTRLIRSEKERIALNAKLQDYDGFLARLENTDHALRQWQQRIEKEQQAQGEKLRRADALTRKIEEALAQQERINRRLEKITQDKMRMIGKLERIEETVIQTRDALEAKALVLLTDRSTAAQTGAPQVPASINDGTDLHAAKRDAVNLLWNRKSYLQAASVAAIVALAAFGGWAISQLPPAPIVTVPYQDSVQKDNVAEHEVTAPSEEEASTPAQTETKIDPLAMDDKALTQSFEQDEAALGAALNQIEPSIPAAAPVKEETVKEKAEEKKEEAVKPAAFTPSAQKDSGKTVKIEDADIESFVTAQKETKPLAQRIKPDKNLPSVIAEIEKKAFDGVPEAQHDLAAIYTAGHGGVSINYERAAKWFREAALQGVANARYNLGVLYQQGLGVEKSTDKAIGWYRAAAQLGHPEAQYNLGIAHIEGEGAEYNPRLAAQFFENAANSGIVEASYNLGLIHENGLLGDPTPKEALYWYKRAADAGSPEAKIALEQLAKSMNISLKDIDAIFTASQKTDGAAVTAKKPAAKNTTAKKTAPESKAGTANAALNPFPKVPVSDAAPAQETGSDSAIIAQIQEQLIRLGLYPGPADGISGPQTEDAIRSYQSSHGLDRTGRANEALLVHMLTNELESTITPGGLNEEDLLPPGEFGARN